MLRLQNINTFYGEMHVLKNISLHINEGEMVSIIGANGAGKTTLLNTISGILGAKSGQILYNNKDISNLDPEKIVLAGISQVPEGRQIFAPLSVFDNLQLGAYTTIKKLGKNTVQNDIESIYSLFPRLKERSNQYAGTLSGGEQQMLAIGRALMSRPSLLLLDEPSMGLAPIIVRDIFKTLQQLQSKNSTTIMLVEQNAKMAISHSDRSYVVETGKIIMEGYSKELIEDPEIQRAYLGKQQRPIWE